MFRRRERKFIGDKKYLKKYLILEVFRKKTTIIFALGFASFLVAIYLFSSGNLILGGIPSSVIIKFLQDSVAVDAYLNNNGALVHDRLQKLNIEKDIKDYYRNQIADPIELDRYIHQILYERTGYVGVDYQLSASGTLKLKNGITSPNMTYR